MKYTQTSTR